MSSVYRSVAAWRHALEAVLALGRELSDPDWAAPTECPRWTVKDIYAHLIGGERWMAEGSPQPEDGYEAWVAAPVAARRDSPPLAVLDELRKVYEYRRVQLDRGGIDPDLPTRMATGAPMTLGHLLKVRALDVWVHEQDIRRAVGRPGNLNSPGAAITGEVFVAQLPRAVAKTAGAPRGSVVRLTTTGEVAMDLAVAVDRTGRGALVSADRPTLTHLTMSWEAFTRLCAGRGSRGDYEIRTVGDRDLAERVLAALRLTP